MAGFQWARQETVDNRVIATLGTGDVRCCGRALRVRCCAGLTRDTYDAMFDLWFPAALGKQAVITTEDESAGSGFAAR